MSVNEYAFGFAEKTLEFCVLVKNLTDEESDNVALLGSTFGTNTYFALVQPPRTVTAQLRANF